MIRWYDKILLCIENSCYSLKNSFSSRKGIDGMKNYFTIDSLSSGRQCLDWIQNSCEKYQKDGYIIVFVFNLHALAVINSLIEIGAPASCILLVKTEDSALHAFYEDGQIRNKILNQLRFLGVRVKAYSFVDFRKESHLGTIETIIFSKNEELVEASCIMLVNCSNPIVSPDLVEVIDQADLVWMDDHLVVNDNFETNDKNILAAGTGTKLDKISASHCSERDKLSPYLIGEHLAKALFEMFDNSENAAEEGREKGFFSIHRECHLPGGYTYLYLQRNESDLDKLKRFKTSSKDGEFRLYVDQHDKISGLHCLFYGYLPTENLVQLCGIHLSTFPWLDEANDLFMFFQQPRVLAVFHDR